MSVNFPDIKAFGTAPFEAFTAATASSTKGLQAIADPWSTRQSPTKGLQAIAAETTDYSKKSFEKSRVLFEKLTGVKKFDEAIRKCSRLIFDCNFGEVVWKFDWRIRS